ncbi:MAG: hypothetical protein RR444_12110, partial [Oscillospiraceae bacterium]
MEERNEEKQGSSLHNKYIVACVVLIFLSFATFCIFFPFTIATIVLSILNLVDARKYNKKRAAIISLLAIGVL